MKTKQKKVVVGGSYLELIREFPLRPIKSDAEYDRATVLIDRVAVRGEADLDAGETDYLDALTVFIEKYDDEHFPIDMSDLTGLGMVKHIFENAGMKQSELAKLLSNTPAAASMIVAGIRPITADHARAPGKRFKLNAGVFL